MRERLKLSLSLRIGAAVHEVPGGNVRRISISMTPYGVAGELEFVLQDDAKKGGKYRDELLDWRGEARVPLAGQGQHLFLGKTGKNNTSVLHDYQAEKPVFRILRTNQSDTSFFKLEEGKLTLRVEEKAGG